MLLLTVFCRVETEAEKAKRYILPIQLSPSLSSMACSLPLPNTVLHNVVTSYVVRTDFTLLSPLLYTLLYFTKSSPGSRHIPTKWLNLIISCDHYRGFFCCFPWSCISQVKFLSLIWFWSNKTKLSSFWFYFLFAFMWLIHMLLQVRGALKKGGYCIPQHTPQISSNGEDNIPIPAYESRQVNFALHCHNTLFLRICFFFSYAKKQTTNPQCACSLRRNLK